MLFGMLGAFDARVEADNLVITLDKRSSHIEGAAEIAGELKKHASDFFGRDMGIRFVGDMEKKEDGIDDYVREAELLFRT
jgi:hypothetical protein